MVYPNKYVMCKFTENSSKLVCSVKAPQSDISFAIFSRSYPLTPISVLMPLPHADLHLLLMQPTTSEYIATELNKLAFGVIVTIIKMPSKISLKNSYTPGEGCCIL